MQKAKNTMSHHFELSEAAVKKFWSDGYLHLKNVFTPEEIQRFRHYLDSIKAYETVSSLLIGDLLSDPCLSEFMVDDRIIATTKKILGGNPVYFGDSAYKFNSAQVLPGKWHRDNVDRDNPQGPDWVGQYPIIRFGVFLQNHKHQGGGIMFRKYSHKKVLANLKLEILKEEIWGNLNHCNRYMGNEVGDMLIWNLRTAHAGMGRYLRGIHPRITISKRLAQILPSFLQATCNTQRYLVSATFGLAGAHLDRYINRLKEREYMQQVWANIHHQPDKSQLLQEKGVTIMLPMNQSAAGELVV